jgi:hypothetical protein
MSLYVALLFRFFDFFHVGWPLAGSNLLYLHNPVRCCPLGWKNRRKYTSTAAAVGYICAILRLSIHPAIASSCIRFRRGHISFLIPSSKDRRRRTTSCSFFLDFLTADRVAQHFARSAPAHKNLVISFPSHRAPISLSIAVYRRT